MESEPNSKRTPRLRCTVLTDRNTTDERRPEIHYEGRGKEASDKNKNQ